MKNKFFSVALLMSLFIIDAAAQEVEFPLSSNPVIKTFVRNHPPSQHSNLRTSQSALPLPFFDDFSGQNLYPNTQLWLDSDAYVNETMGDNPVTIGVATLDGIDQYGNPHDSTSQSSQPVICDHLTSQTIDLSTVTAADSVYFSFYYQPQGWGDEPEDGDSLVLEFYANDSSWMHIWVANGTPKQPFAEVRIKVDNGIYFWSGFQFRFYNYGNPNGNRDHWNIDYVRLKANESYAEPLQEIALVNPIKSYLKEFTAMPYSHYKSEVAAGRNPVKDTISDQVKLYNFTGTTSLALNDTVRTHAGAVIFGAQSAPDLNPSQNSTDNFIITPPAQMFDTTSGHQTDFLIKHSFSGLAAGDTANDDSYLTQHFYNYYAYDDGTAESATGVHVAYTKYAYQFDVKKADWLLGIQIFFNPWGINVHQDLFSLCLWSNINVPANTDNLVYQTIDQKPANTEAINGFADYYFDTAQWVNAGTNYIGIIQSSQDEIGIGVDHNTDSHTKMFLSFNGQWYNSTITGSWMMRPIFGSKLTIGVNEIAQGNFAFDIFPNPAADKVWVECDAHPGHSSVTVTNLVGEKILTVPFAERSGHTAIDVHSLPAGIYFIRISDGSNILSGVKKLVIER
jgi:hypothetical protein